MPGHQNMQRTAITTLVLATAMSTLSAAQETTPDLARARTAFATSDLDKSGSITLREAQASGHTPTEFRVFDLDGDGKLTQDEFIVGYKERVTSRGRRVAPDLENEARRVLAKRRSEQADAARKRNGGAAQDGPASRRSEALKEKAQAPGQDPARLRNQLQKKGAKGSSSASNGTSARSRATGTLTNLQKRATQSTQGAAPAQGATTTPAQGATTTRAQGATTTRAQGATTTRAQGATTTPAQGATTTRAQGATTTPVQGASTTPAQGASTTPAQGATTTRAQGASTTRAQGASTTRAQGATTTPAQGATSSTQAPVQRRTGSSAANGGKSGESANTKPADGPASRRMGQGRGLTPEELQRALRERRKRAAAAQEQDPRVQDAKRRVEQRRAQSGAGRSSGTGGGSTGRSTGRSSGSTTGRGTSGGSSGGTRSSGTRSSGGDR